MRTLTWAAAGVCVLSVAALVAYRKSCVHTVATDQKSVHIILVGASIGQAWNLSNWPARAKSSGFTAEAVQAWQFDKSEALDEVLMRPARKFRVTRTYLKSLFQPPPPKADIIILKECSSYFPGDLTAYERKMEHWAHQAKAEGARVVLATVVPITESRSAKDKGKQEALLAYNRWVRAYGEQKNIPVLDLESALRIEGETGYLRDEFTSGDGSHLNAAAYAVLDQLLLRTLQAMGKPGVSEAQLHRTTH